MDKSTMHDYIFMCGIGTSLVIKNEKGLKIIKVVNDGKGTEFERLYDFLLDISKSNPEIAKKLETAGIKLEVK